MRHPAAFTFALSVALALAGCGIARAQTPFAPCVTVTSSATGVPTTSCPVVTSSNPLPVTSSGGGLAANVTVVNPLAGSGSVKTVDDNSAAILTAVQAPIPTGTNIIGKTGIDQTTPGTTNAVSIPPSSASAIGITPVVSTAGESSHVLKASAGNAYSIYATNLTATAGFLVLLNATSAPADGAITPLACAPLSANGVASLNYAPGPPGVFSTGITAVVTSANTCFTKTTGVITAFISGSVQ